MKCSQFYSNNKWLAIKKAFSPLNQLPIQRISHVNSSQRQHITSLHFQRFRQGGRR